MNKPFIVAEMSSNHGGDLTRAMKIIDAAKEAGADAVKFQTYRVKDMVVSDYLVKGTAWNRVQLKTIYAQALTPLVWHKDLFSHAKDIGIIPFSSPFSEEMVDFLEDLDCPMYKIASFEINDRALIKAAARTGKPLIMSTGVATWEEITEAIEWAKEENNIDITLLHCVSSYPAKPEEFGLLRMKDLALAGRNIFRDWTNKVGLSDHSLGSHVAVAATVLGASMIEKHLTLARGNGFDSFFSMEPEEFKMMVDACRDIEKAMKPILLDSELAMQFKRSLYFIKELKKGDVITRDSIQSARPFIGLEPKYLEEIIGKTVNIDVIPGLPVLSKYLG